VGFFDGLGNIFGRIETTVGDILRAPTGGGGTFGGSLANLGVNLLASKFGPSPARQSPVGVGLPPGIRGIVPPGFGGRTSFNPISPVAFTGGIPAMAVLPGGFNTAGFSDLFSGGLLGSGGDAAACPSNFRITPGGAVPMREVWQQNPVTGAMTLFKPAGRVLLTQSDVTAARKVDGLVRKLGRGRRRPR